jgi:iron complex outermembrane receptor protein
MIEFIRRGAADRRVGVGAARPNRVGALALLVLSGQDTTLVRVDTTQAARLSTIEVRVTRGRETRLAVPATVAVVDSAAFRGAQLQNGIDEALGRVAGLYVANRFNPSLDQRLVIRGAGARANFGVRGLKVLLDGIPQTLPDGQTQLTNLDLGLIDRAEVLLGAASALYGNAGGGVIALSTGLPAAAFSARARTLAGSFGSTRLAGQASAMTGLWSGTIGVSRYASDGFRQQSTTESNQLSVGINRVIGANWLIKARYSLARSPEARNPGALTTAELAVKPDSAAANNILRGADKSVTQHQLGLTATTSDGRGNSVDATVFGLTRDLVNPLATAPPGPPGATVGTFSGIDRRAGGARLAIQRRLDSQGTRLGLGGDFQTMRDDRINRRSRGGLPTDTVVAEQRETVAEIGPFASLHLEPTDRLTITATVRYDRVRFQVRDRFLADGVDQSGVRSMSALSGSGGINLRVGPTMAAYSTVASAFETPTTTELVNQANGTVGFNRSLGPQRTVAAEAGLRTIGPIATTVAVYRSRVRDALVQAREADGRAFFENAGRLRIQGIEASVAWRPAGPLSGQLSYGHTDARFDRYLVRNGAATDTLDGKEVPGVPRHLLRVIATLTLGKLTAEWDHQFTSRYFADDRNTLAIEGWDWGVAAIRLRADLPIGTGATRTNLAPFLAINNVWDRRYVASANVNGFGGRVFEPAPGRWVFVGLEVGVVR